MFIECSACVSLCAKCFTSFISFKSSQQVYEAGTIIMLISAGKLGPGRVAQ